MELTEESQCPHCDSAVAAAHPDAPYCCSGCRAAHLLLQSSGLDDYYRLREGPSVPAKEQTSTLTWLPPLVEAAEMAARDGVARVRLELQGIHCAGCVWVIEKLFDKREGARHIRVNPGAGSLELFWTPGELDVGGYLADIERLGYPTAPAGADLGRAPRSDLALRMAVAIAIAMNTMILSASVYFGLAPDDDGGLYQTFLQVSFGLSAISVWVGGGVFIRAAWRSLKSGAVHLDLPIALGIVLAFAGSSWAFLFGGGEHAYFDTLTAFIALMLVGRWLQHRVVEKNRRSLLSDRGAEGLQVRVVRDGRAHVVAARELSTGDEMVVAPGEMLPVRGTLEDDAAELSLEWINGEATPRAYARGDELPAGAQNRSGIPLRASAGEPFRASRLHSLLGAGGAVELDETSPFSFMTTLARVYVFAVLGLAALGLWLWWGAGPARAFEVAIAILVVTCPCALGLATPLAIELAESGLRRAGVFVRRHRLLERILEVRHVVFDKTGTLTLGDLEVSDPRPLTTLDEEAATELMKLASLSNHPKSRAIARALERVGVDAARLDDGRVEERPGEGVECRSERATWRLGRASFAGGDEGDDVCFSRGGRVLARFTFEEVLRPDTARELRALEEAGLRITLLSGDDEGRVARFAGVLGLDPDAVKGGLSPEDKAAFVQREDARDTLMLGDGINDALAVDAAWCAGTPAVDRPTLPSRADFYLVGHRAAPITTLRSVAAQLRSVLFANLALATAYNVLAVGAALMGWMSPLAAALAMPASSLLILLFTLRRLARPEREPEEQRVASSPLLVREVPA
jgi:Cu2+-exporting ATPase